MARALMLILIATVCPPAHAQTPAKTQPLKITLKPGGWGDGSPEDFQKIVNDTASHLWKLFPGRKLDPIEVAYGDDGPITYFGRGKNGEIRVRLEVKGAYWAQLAYQFAHEFGHILCDYKEGSNANQWFEESICEVASLYALRRMRETWKTHPPFERARRFAPALHRYTQQRIDGASLPDGVALNDWFEANRKRLRNPYLRKLNNIAAVQMLPLFEAEPEGWAAVAYLNSGEQSATQSFEDYLADWHRHTPQKHKGFVVKVAGLFGVRIEAGG